MPVCIAGMHRSGTSMVTRLLNLCGLYLGADSDLAHARADNPEGFWEHMGFVNLNDELLKHLGGDWNHVPPVAEGWQSHPALEGLRQRARELVRTFSGREPWGWKDPRSCLTLPFWQQVVPDLRCLVCLRNPIDVALSLCRRDGFTLERGLELWAASHDRLLAAAGPEQRVVTHYSSFFHDPQTELQRMLGTLTIAASANQVEQACGTIAPNLRHSHLSTETLLLAHREPDSLCAKVPTAVVETYRALCREAGPVFFATEEIAKAKVDPRVEIARIRLAAALAAQEGQLAEKTFLLAEQERQLAAQERQLAERERQLVDAQARVQNLAATLNQPRHRIVDWFVAFYGPILRRLGL